MKNLKNNQLPQEFNAAHDLCFMLHDIMLQAIVSGEEGGFFITRLDLPERSREVLENSDDIFAWLESEGRLKDRAEVVRNTVLPAVLSDMLHCIYESLQTSKKAKLGVSYMLIRKPLQESLFVLESIVLGELEFSNTLANDPLKLRSHTVGGLHGHSKRIQRVLEIIGEVNRFDAEYISRLRYDKGSYDSFDGVCNLAMHLFTEHKDIKTEQLNINFIFSGWQQRLSQWHYLYSRLPYLLFYAFQIVEYIVATIAPTSAHYLDYIQRRSASSIILWWEGVDDYYKCVQLRFFVEETMIWLDLHCASKGRQYPTRKDLVRMRRTGALPGDSDLRVKAREIEFKLIARLNNANTKGGFAK